MIYLVPHLLHRSARRFPNQPALEYRQNTLTYADLSAAVMRVAGGLQTLAGVRKYDRVAVCLEKRFEYVVAMFGALEAGGIFVPVNPLLKPSQVEHILADAGVRVLITTAPRHALLKAELATLKNPPIVIEIDDSVAEGVVFKNAVQNFVSEKSIPMTLSWSQITSHPAGHVVEGIDDDTAAILYTSGSTGAPKGVVLSHRNMIVGAQSVSTYLDNKPTDRLLAVLPFSFDYGLSQLTTAFHVGACVVLFNYFFPKDVIRALDRERITALAAVPPLWNQLATYSFPDTVKKQLRYITNSGGAMPAETLARLRAELPSTQVYLMYGLTEAFRSTYLPPDALDSHPGSMGRAIPNADVRIVDEQGEPVKPGETGELVHCGALVAKGYWNDPERTRERFRTIADPAGGGGTLPAVWSGDTVRIDDEGFLYFVGRRDEMIKTSGYRVSPTEIEAIFYHSGWILEAVAFAIPDLKVGQAIVVLVSGLVAPHTVEELNTYARREMPLYMVPAHIVEVAEIPRNPNGKIDRKRLEREWVEKGDNS